MLLEMKLPSPGESISEVEIAQWLVEDGEFVEKDQSIAEIDSDKATLELPAEESGTIKIVVEEGVTAAVGDIVCIIDTSAKGEKKQHKTEHNRTKQTERDIRKEQRGEMVMSPEEAAWRVEIQRCRIARCLQCAASAARFCFLAVR